MPLPPWEARERNCGTDSIAGCGESFIARSPSQIRCPKCAADAKRRSIQRGAQKAKENRCKAKNLAA